MKILLLYSLKLRSAQIRSIKKKCFSLINDSSIIIIPQTHTHTHTFNISLSSSLPKLSVPLSFPHDHDQE